ncbi:MAG: MotA/TolQ/ExbB proton channel family protein [Phycisphaerae bacterium]
MQRMNLGKSWLTRLCTAAWLVAGAAGATLAPAAHGQDLEAPPADGFAAEVDLVQVNWVEELASGGLTMVALAALSVAMVAFAVERAISVRRARFCPPGLVAAVLPMVQKRQYAKAVQWCGKKPSILSDVISHIITHRNNDMRVIADGAGDLAGREVADQQEKTYPLAVIAALAPLLGLLGTMIGMIEAFKLVEVFGDEGGASMLAGSISKALITTAVGLILAIPSLILFHFFRRRIHGHSIAMEREVDRLLNAMYLKAEPLTDGPGATAAEAAQADAPPSTADAARQASRRPAGRSSEAEASVAPPRAALAQAGAGAGAGAGAMTSDGNTRPRKD